MSYRIKLPVFEGPLDLLLFLIRREEVEIYDIPIAKITKEYLEYIDLMRELDLEVASEFIYMAATLIRIKVQMMLPRPPVTEEDAEDPRTGLVKSLLEYQRYKEVSERMRDIEDQSRKKFYRQYFRDEGFTEEELTHYNEVSLFDLMEALKIVLETMPKRHYHDIRLESITVEERVAHIKSLLVERGKIVFTELIGESRERSVIIVTFLALLEMVKQKTVVLYQLNPFQEIWVSSPKYAAREEDSNVAEEEIKS